jgi:hypothetical protein
MTRTSHGDGSNDPDRRSEGLGGERVARARNQLAVARTVLAELDRVLPAGTTSVDEQLAGELRRLSGLLAEIARPFGGEGVSSPPRSRPLLLRAVPRADFAVHIRQVGRRS